MDKNQVEAGVQACKAEAVEMQTGARANLVVPATDKVAVEVAGKIDRRQITNA